MASYHGNAMPRFQHTMSRNRKSGELQRLRSEYERIKDFSDYTIALRIRQVRLWRLFRKIQDINAVSSSRAKIQRKQPKSYEQMRADTLSRARDLGMEFSRENGLNVQRHAPAPPRATPMPPLADKTAVDSKMSTTARRLTYGNVTSYENMRRFNMNKRKLSVRSSQPINGLRSVTSMEVEKVEKLRNCTNYDSSTLSYSDIKAKPYNRKPLESRSKSKVPTNSVGSSAELPAHDMIKNYTFVLDESSTKQSENISGTVQDQEQDLVSLWNELKVRIPILKSVPLKELMKTPRRNLENIFEAKTEELTEEQAADESCNSRMETSYEEYELRKIDNDRNLPASQLRFSAQKTTTLIDDSIEDKRIMENEEIVRILRLSEHDSTNVYNENVSERGTLKSATSTECVESNAVVNEEKEKKVPTHPSLKNKPVASLDLRTAQHAQVEDFVKRYEPFPRLQQENPQTRKDNFESGVVKLRSIFEHQGE